MPWGLALPCHADTFALIPSLGSPSAGLWLPDAIKYENGRDICGSSIIVEWAKGNPRRPLSQGYDECYRCHRPGHWARDCPDDWYGGRRRSVGRRSPSPVRSWRRSRSHSRSRSRSRDRYRRRSRSDRRSRSYSRDRKHSHSRSRSPKRTSKSRSNSNLKKSLSRSLSRSKSRSRSGSLSPKKTNGDQDMEPSRARSGSPSRSRSRSKS